MARNALLIGIQNYGMGIEPMEAAPWDVSAVQSVLQHRHVGYFHRIHLVTDLHPEGNTATGAGTSSHNRNGTNHSTSNGPGINCQTTNGRSSNGKVPDERQNRERGDRPIQSEADHCHPQAQTIRHSDLSELIQSWCRSHEPDDLALLYLSGQGFRSATGELYFAASNTYIGPDGLVDAKAIPGYSLAQWLNQSRADQQIVVLDCCFYDDTGQALPEGNDHLALAELLGSEQRVVLSASTTANYFAEQKRDRQSVYTHYWVEGLSGGAADADGKQWISIADLHQYIVQQMGIATPNIAPLIVDPGQIAATLRLGKVCVPNAQAQTQYRQLVHQYHQGDRISPVGRRILDRHRGGLTAEQVERIEQQVIQPYRHYINSLGCYQHAMADWLAKAIPDDQISQQLSQLQQQLGLQNRDVAPINQDLDCLKQLRNMEQYRQALQDAITLEPCLSDHTQQELNALQKILSIEDADISMIEKGVMADRNTHQQHLSYYRHHFIQALGRGKALSPLLREELNLLRQQLGLSHDDVDNVEQHATHESRSPLSEPPHFHHPTAEPHNAMTDSPGFPPETSQHPTPSPGDEGHSPLLAPYELAVRAAYTRQMPISEGDRHSLEQLQQVLHLSAQQVRTIHQHVIAEMEQHEKHYHQTQVPQYEQLFAELVEPDGTVSPANRERLNQLQTQLEINNVDVQTIEQQVLAKRRPAMGLDTEISANSLPSDPTAGPEPNPSQEARFAINGTGGVTELELLQSDNNGIPLPVTPHSDDPNTAMSTPMERSPNHSEGSQPANPNHQNTNQATVLSTPGLSVGLSDRRLNYNLLEQHLENHDWRQADEETLKIMLTATVESVSWMSPDAIKKLPCTDLEKIDALWRRCSNNRFGFTVQHSIFKGVATGDNPAIRFGKKVGWTILDREFVGFKYYNQLTFDVADPNVPLGHLPAKWFWQVPWWESVRSGGLGSGRGGCGEDGAKMLITMMGRFDSCEDHPNTGAL